MVFFPCEYLTKIFALRITPLIMQQMWLFNDIWDVISFMVNKLFKKRQVSSFYRFMVKPWTSDIRVTTITCECHTGDIQVHTSGVRVKYEYIWLTCGWHTSTYDWQTGDIRVTYEYIQVTYGWHTITYKWHTNDILVTYEYIQMT